MGRTSGGRPVLVAVDRPDRAAVLVRTGSDIAAILGQSVRVITVAVKPPDSPFGVFEDATIIENYAEDSRAILARATDVAPSGVDVDSEIIVEGSVAAGILEAVETHDPAAVVIGWDDQHRRRDAILGTTVDRLIKRLPCDLYIERIGAAANGVDSILLPVAGGPHVRPAALAAKAIAVRNDARVTIATVAGGDVSTAAADEYGAVARSVLGDLPGPAVEVVETSRSGSSVVDEIVAVAADHDVIVFGATRQGALRRRVVGSIPRHVAERTDGTVILGRAGEAIADRSRGWARIWSSIREPLSSDAR